MSISRRQFVIGGCSAAIAAMAGGRINGLVFDNPDFAGTAQAAGATDQILVMIFLRGGCDGLSLVSPFNDPIYVQARDPQGLAVPAAAGTDILTTNNATYDAASSFRLHPSHKGVVSSGGVDYTYSLQELYDSGDMAIIHACGLNDDTRSHFDAMDYIERGTPGDKNTSSGWLARHLQVVNAAGTIPALASSTAAPTSLLGSASAVAATSASSYRLSGPGRYTNTSAGARPLDAMLTTLDQIYTGAGPTVQAGRRTIEAIRALRTTGSYTTAVNPPYPNGSFGDALKNVAQLIKLDLGLRVATVDLGGWDHHENEGVNGGTFSSLVGTLSRGLYSFYADLAAYHGRLTILVQSEFGRRLGANASAGTDHGHGGVMLALGGNVNGGKLYGAWPGLLDLDQDQDLRTTTDFRTILGEAVVRVLGNSKLGTVFPGITPQVYSPATALNVFKGTDPADIDYTSSMYQAFLPSVMR